MPKKELVNKWIRVKPSTHERIANIASLDRRTMAETVDIIVEYYLGLEKKRK